MATNSRLQEISEEMIAQVVSMGFDEGVVRAAVHHLNDNMDRVVTELVQRGGIIPADWYQGQLSNPEPSISTNNSNSDSGILLLHSNLTC